MDSPNPPLEHFDSQISHHPLLPSVCVLTDWSVGHECPAPWTLEFLPVCVCCVFVCDEIIGTHSVALPSTLVLFVKRHSHTHPQTHSLSHTLESEPGIPAVAGVAKRGKKKVGKKSQTTNSTILSHEAVVLSALIRDMNEYGAKNILLLLFMPLLLLLSCSFHYCPLVFLW